jgi:choline dehydrogenase-like flavoprotein
MDEYPLIRETRDEFDVIVIGSGVTGGWAAKEFCERGFRTLMIERGPFIEHRKDYPGEGVPPWQLPHRGALPKALADSDYAVQQKCYALTEANRHLFGNDRELPYQTEAGTQFNWIRGNSFGGKSLLWARQSYRWSDYDFNANAADGHGIDWPVRYDDLAPWYSYVERHIGVSGSAERLPQLPDSEFQPPFEMNVPEIAFKRVIEVKYPGRQVIIGRTANLTRPTVAQKAAGRVACQARNECHLGCSFGAYFSTQSSTLPAALRTGNLSIAPNSVVHSLACDEKTGRVRTVRVIDREDLSEREYVGSLVFLCASTLGSTQVLLHSTSKRFPHGLANSSGVLGHFLMDHVYNQGADAHVPGYQGEYYAGRRPTGIYVPNFHFEPRRYGKGFLRGYAFGGSAGRAGWEGGGWRDGFGADYKESLTQAGDWWFNLYAQGEMLPRYENQVALHPTLKDKWGIPQLHFNVRWGDNEYRMMESASATAADMLEAAGFDRVRSGLRNSTPGLAIHEVGSARMGRDPRESVFNEHNQAHDVPNLFCTDGSTFCSSATQNPSLTFMAFTARAVDYAAREMKEKRIQ